MNVTQFAEQHRLKVRRDDCSEKIISGKAGHVYENGDDRFGICLMFKSARKWMSVQRRLLAAGFTLGQDGDSEGTLLFDPTNADQVAIAIRESRIRQRRVLSEDARIALADRLNRKNSPRPRNANEASGQGNGHPVGKPESFAENTLYFRGNLKLFSEKRGVAVG